VKNLDSRRIFLEKIGLTTLMAATSENILANKNNELKKKYKGEKIKIALCGLGRYAGYLADGLLETKFCELTGLVTGTPSKAVSWSKKYNIQKKNIYNYQNFDEIINNPDIDLVYIVLPNAMHKEYTIRAAKAKKHVIVEKPMANTAADCIEMMQVAKENNVQIGMGYRLHYEPYNLEMKRLGQEKVFGKVRLVEASLGYKNAAPTTGSKEWRLVKKLAGGGPLMNLGVYCVQAARYITGEEPVSVTAQFGPVSNSEKFSEVEETISWQMTFPSGALSSSISTYSAGIDRLFAASETGAFELSPAISYGPFKGRSSNGVFNFPEINQQTAQMDGICKVLLENKPLPEHIAGIEGWKDMKIIDAIYKSAKTGKRVKIE
jgi:predicted dehydrogenase